jgi:hypothetical protein
MPSPKPTEVPRSATAGERYAASLTVVTRPAKRERRPGADVGTAASCPRPHRSVTTTAAFVSGSEVMCPRRRARAFDRLAELVAWLEVPGNDVASAAPRGPFRRVV